MGDPLNNPFAQQAIYRHLPSSQGLPMDNAGGPQQPPSLAPAIPSMPGGVQDPNQAKLWKAIGDQYRRGPNAGGNPAQFLQNLAHMQPGQRGFPANHAMALASGPQAGQSNLAQNPAAQQQFLQQQSMQRLGLGLPQQQQQQQLGAGAAPGMGGLQHPGLANASQAHLNNLAQSNGPALMSLINNMQNNGMGQPGNPLMNNLLRNPNNVLDLHNRNMLDPSMSEQLQAIQRARGNLQPGLAQGAAGAAGQHIRLPSNEHNNSPLLSAPHDQNPMGLNRSPQPGNPQHQGMGPQNAQTLALIHKLDSIPVRDLEARVAAWRDNMPNMEARVQELLGAASRPGATPEIGTAYARAKSDLDQNKFLFIKAQEILNRKHVQAQNQMAQAQAQAQAQAHAQAQAAARMTPTIGEQNRPGSRAAGGLPGQAPGMPGWQQPGSSSTPQLAHASPPGTSSTPFQPVPSPQPNAEQQNQQASPAFRQGAPRQTAIPRDRAAFVHFIRLWFVQTGRNVDAIPKIGDKPLDLHQLYIEVETLGGPEKVQATGLWRLVAVKMGYVTHEQNDPQLAQIAKVLADTYVALLVPFDNFCLDRMRAVGTGIQNNRLGQMGLNPQMGMGGTPAVQAGLRPGPGGMLPGDGANTVSMANFQRVLAFLQVTLKDWMPEAPPQTKLLRASQMDVAQMQREGWPAERITIVQRFRPALMQFRATFLRQQQMHQQALSQQGMQQQNAQAQAQQQQANAQQQQPHVNDHRSSSGGGSLPPNMQAHNIHGLPGAAGPVKLPFPPEVTERAKMIVSQMAREIEQTRQYQRREVPEVQRVAMNSSVVAAHPFAVEFERTVSLHFMLLNNQQQTRNLMEQAALLREQHRILQNGQQQYIMTLDEVNAVQNSLRLAIHNLKTTYAARVKQHQEQMANLRAAEAGGAQLGQQQPTAAQVQQVQQHMLQQHPQQQQQALAAMSFLNANAGLQPGMVQQRPPSQPQYGSPKPDPGKAPAGLMPQQPKPVAASSMAVKQRKPVAPGQPVNTPSPAAALTPNMESAPTPSSANEPATPKSPKNKAKAGPTVKRTPTQPPKKKQSMKIELPPPGLEFNQPASNKRQREDDVPPAAEPVIPVAGPSSPKRMKTELESVEPIKLEHSNDDPLESMEQALAGLQNVAPGPNGEGIDPDILAQLSEILDGAGGAAGASGSAQPPSLDQPPDASGPKVEDVFDFSYYLNDTLGDDDPLGGPGVDLEADTPDLNTNKETPDSAADDIEHLGKSPGKGEMPAGAGGKDLAGNRAPTLTEGFWEAFNDGEMAEGAYYAGGGANGFNWSGPIEPNASWIGITGTAA